MFGEEGLNQPAEAVQVLQIVIAARPEQRGLYASLAEYAYKAHNPRIGDLASAKAIALAPPAQRKQLKAELAAIKAHPNGNEAATSSAQAAAQAAGAAGAATGATTTTIPTPTGSSSTTTKK